MPEASSQRPVYVRVPQSLLNFVNRQLKTYDDVRELAADCDKTANLVLSFDANQPPYTAWGTVTYMVNEDGSLVTFASKLDTSD